MRIANKHVTAIALTVVCVAHASGPGKLSFPESFDHPQVLMRLERGQCNGSCPEYSVEIRGDGSVTYEGRRSVLIEGKLSWIIPQSDAAALIDEFRRADYFKLADEYSDGAFDSGSSRSLLTIAKSTKSVSASGVSICKADEPTDRCVPKRVSALHDAIDRLSGVPRMTQGNGLTIPLLEKAGFDFQSSAAASALLMALHEMNTGLARQLLSRGAPMNGGGLENPLGEKWRPSAILLVPANGDLELAQSMIVGGALADMGSRQLFLLASAASGSAAMTKLALEHYSDVRKKPAPYPWVVAAAAAMMHTEGTHWQELYARPEYALWVRNFDPPAVLRLLIAAGAEARAVGEDGNTALHLVGSGAGAQVLLDAGADPNAINATGRTPLHEAQREDLARVLIRAGARPNAQDAEGATPLFDRYDAKTAQVLLKAGADVKHRAPNGTTALFFQSDAKTTVALIQAGADVNARMRGGLSVLESAKSIESALVILRAGALLPDDPARLEKIMTWAAANNANELKRELQDRAARQGR